MMGKLILMGLLASGQGSVPGELEITETAIKQEKPGFVRSASQSFIQSRIFNGHAGLVGFYGVGLSLIGITAGIVACDPVGGYPFILGLFGIGSGVMGTVTGILGWHKAHNQHERIERIQNVKMIESEIKSSFVIVVTRGGSKNFSFDKDCFFERASNGVRKNLTFGFKKDVWFVFMGLCPVFAPLPGTRNSEIKLPEELIDKIIGVRQVDENGESISVAVGEKMIPSDGLLMSSDLLFMRSSGVEFTFIKIVKDDNT